jgi:hypothetical protein
VNHSIDDKGIIEIDPESNLIVSIPEIFWFTIWQRKGKLPKSCVLIATHYFFVVDSFPG